MFYCSVLRPFFRYFVVNVRLGNRTLVGLHRLFSRIPTSYVSSRVVSAVVNFVSLSRVVPTSRNASATNGPERFFRLIVAVRPLRVRIDLFLEPSVRPKECSIDHFVRSNGVGQLLIGDGHVRTATSIRTSSIQCYLIYSYRHHAGHATFPNVSIQRGPRPTPLHRLVTTRTTSLFPHFLVSALNVQCYHYGYSFGPFRYHFAYHP